MIQGNIEGLSKVIMAELESLMDMDVPKNIFCTVELAEKLCRLTSAINREISIYIGRNGNILDVSVGDVRQVSLAYMGMRRSKTRLSGIRCIHTHPAGDGTLSGVDINALTSLMLDSMAAIGVREGRFSNGYIAFINPPDSEEEFTTMGPLPIGDFCSHIPMDEIFERDKFIKRQEVIEVVGDDGERAILIGLDNYGEGMVSLEELEQLANTAGAVVIDKVLQNIRAANPSTYIGKGKAEELSWICKAQNIDVVICDDELSSSQIRNLEEIVGVKVIDRTALILDIFALRAKSKEGKLQVELAQLRYRLPRLTGMGLVLSRLGGGIGTRGPGETKLETDRRHIRRRIKEIEEELKKVDHRRMTHRERRNKEMVPVIALVGYTNAGKSSLLNALAGSDALVENKLFATLDPVSRGITLPSGQEALLIDTVGFINKLPHDLVEAFKSTLEEATYADLLLHVADASSQDLEKQVKVVESLLESLDCNQEIITVYNKMDLLKDPPCLLPPKKPVALISAKTGEGLEELERIIEENLPIKRYSIELLIPYTEGQIASLVHSQGQVLEEEYREEGIYLMAELDPIYYSRLEDFKINQ